jgi:CRP-like cAMP-binding protein
MARGSKAKVDQLRNVPLFSSCSTRDLQKIAGAVDETTVKAGAKLADQGQQGREAFIIVEGTCTVARNGKKVATLGPGAVVGELSLLDHGPRTATVTADTDMDVLVLDQRHFMGVLDDVPALSHKLLASLAGRIRELDKRYFG